MIAMLFFTGLEPGGAYPSQTLLSTLFSGAAAGYAADHAHVPGLVGAALIHGCTTAFWWAAGIFGMGLFVALLILPPNVKPRVASGEPSLATD